MGIELNNMVGNASVKPDADPYSTLVSVQRVLATATGFSVAAIDCHGGLLVHYTHPQDTIHNLAIWDSQIIASVLLKNPQEFCLVNSLGGMTFMSCPIVVRQQQTGYILVGPVWETPPTPEQMQELVQITGWTNSAIMEAILNHPAPVPLDLVRGKEIVTTLAEVTGQWIDRERSQRESLEAMQSIYSTSTKISSSLDTQEILVSTIQGVIDLYSAEAASIQLVDRARDCFSIVYKDGPQSSILHMEDIAMTEDYDSWLEDNQEARIITLDGKTSMSIPLLLKNECLGVLRITSKADDVPYRNDDLQVLGLIAGNASSALEKARVHSQALRQFRELEALQKVGVSLTSTVDVSRTLQQVLDHACELLEAQAASVMLLEPGGKYLRIHVARGLPEEVISTTKVRLGERIAGKVAVSGIPQHTPRNINEYGDIIDASLCVPLKVEDKVIGVLNVRGHAGAMEFTTEDLNLATRLANMSAAAISNSKLHEQLRNMFVESITALANSIDARDPYTRGHSERVAQYALLMGEKLNFTSDELFKLRSASLLHDIGKIKIRDNILNKPGKLEESEFVEMKRHAVYGAGIMFPVLSFRPLIPYILHHHERYDGKGYPDHKAGEEIPFCARLICVADSFDAMTSDRPYRKGMDVNIAINILKTDSNTQFDPFCVQIFLELYDEGKIMPIIEKMRQQNAFNTTVNQHFVTAESYKTTAPDAT